MRMGYTAAHFEVGVPIAVTLIIVESVDFDSAYPSVIEWMLIMTQAALPPVLKTDEKHWSLAPPRTRSARPVSVWCVG